jgi:DNA-binding response OmpR family regulator
MVASPPSNALSENGLGDVPDNWHVSCSTRTPEEWGFEVAKTVLIVEDEKLLAKTLSTALKEAGYQAVVTHSAEQAEKRLLGGDHFDLVILDNRLPQVSGLEFLKTARERGVDSKVILMTAFDSREVKAKAKKLDVDEYVRKPFDLDGMIGKVSDLIGDPGNGRR